MNTARADALAVNAGSTSIKLSRFVGGQETSPPPADLDDALQQAAPGLVVHRVVHGGSRTAPVLLDDAEVAQLRALTELAPLHQPPALAAIDRCRGRWPEVPQIACFDTAFHATLPEAARTLALPDRLRALVRVYGFHGLSHAWSAREVAANAPRAARVLIAHLGGGQSLCGVLHGRSVITSMGFTPLDGLVMATRSGTLDTSALLWLAKHTDEDLDVVLESESGLLGLTGSADMQVIVERAQRGDATAQLGLDIWLHRFLRQAGGCIAVLGGLDALVFTGGIGEHSDYVRQMVATAMGFIGVHLTAMTTDAETPTHTREISAEGALVRTFIVHAREDLQMLFEARSVPA